LFTQCLAFSAARSRSVQVRETVWAAEIGDQLGVRWCSERPDRGSPI